MVESEDFLGRKNLAIRKFVLFAAENLVNQICVEEKI